LARHAYPLCLSLPAVPRDLHSFPTRRSSDLNPVLRMRRRLVHGCRAINVMVPRKLAALPNAVLMRGNHELTIGGRPCPPAGHETAYLAHFPVRSPGQYLAKIVIAALQNEVIPDRSPEAGWHYRGPYELAKRDPQAFVA